MIKGGFYHEGVEDIEEKIFGVRNKITIQRILIIAVSH